MTNTLLAMPGDGCRFFYVGHCLYDEHMNPGLHAQFRCAVLATLDEDFDAFVVRCEKLSVEVETAGRIWHKRCEEMLGQHWPCLSYMPDAEADDPDLCAYLLWGLCTLRLPVCPGRCRHYRRGVSVVEDLDFKELS